MPDSTYVVETSSTADVRPCERAEYWSELLSSYHCRMGYRYPLRPDFSARAARQRSHRYQLVEWTQEQGVWVHRTSRHIRDDDDVDYRLAVPVDGNFVVRQDDNEARPGRGTAALFSMEQPFCLGFDVPTRGLVLTIPRTEVDGRVTTGAPVAQGLDLRTGLGRVAFDILVGLVTERDALDRCQFDAICERLVELLCLLLVGGSGLDSAGSLAEVEAMVRKYVRENASDTDLTGESVARALGWSLRQVQRALQVAGTTPRELIREERLRLARERLTSPRFRHCGITEIAHSCGFSSHSVLSNAFRQRYGVSPRDLR